MTEDRFGPAAGSAADEGEDEQALRALLHRAVDGVHPAPDALPRIRHAAVLRRARYRKAWTGAAAIAVLTVAAVPSLPGLGALQLSDGAADGAGATRAPGAATTDPAGPHSAPQDGYPLPGISRPASTSTLSLSAGASSTASGGVAVAPPTATAGAEAGAPDCLPGDLGRGGSVLGTPDATGRRYGIFTVVNVSGRACVLVGSATAVLSDGGAQVQVRDHTVGDPAPALPDPATLPDRLPLTASGSYRVSFAWVPEESCSAASPTASRSASATPGSSVSPAPSTSPAGAAPAGPGAAVPGAGSGASPVAADATPSSTPTPSSTGSPSPAPPVTGPPAWFTLSHLAAPGGSAVATAVITGGCAGTVYHSAPQPAQ